MKEKMHTGELYLPGDEDIIKEQVIYQDKLCEYNLIINITNLTFIIFMLILVIGI